MLSVESRIDLLDEADAIASRRDFSALDDLLRAVDRSIIDDEPLLRYYEIASATHLGKTSQAVALQLAATNIFEREQDSRLYRRYLNLSGIISTNKGELGIARDIFSRVFSISTQCGDQQLMADATMNLGVIADMCGRWNDAVAAHLRALSAFTRMGDNVMVAGCHHNLGMTYRQLDLLDDSRSRFDIALDLYQQHGTRPDIIATVLEKSLLLVKMGEIAIAEAIARGAYREVRNIAHIRLIGEAQRVLGITLLETGRVRWARRYLEAGRQNSLVTGNRLLQAETAEALARLFRIQGDVANSKERHDESLQIYTEIGSASGVQRLSRLQTEH